MKRLSASHPELFHPVCSWHAVNGFFCRRRALFFGFGSIFICSRYLVAYSSWTALRNALSRVPLACKYIVNSNWVTYTSFRPFKRNSDAEILLRLWRQVQAFCIRLVILALVLLKHSVWLFLHLLQVHVVQSVVRCQDSFSFNFTLFGHYVNWNLNLINWLQFWMQN